MTDNWTTEALKEHIEQIADRNNKASIERTEQLRREMDFRQKAQQDAIDKAEKAMEHRFESINAFRSQLADQTQTFMTREAYQGAHDVLVEKVTALENRITSAEGQTAGRALTFRVIAASTASIATIITVAVLLIRFAS